MRFTRLVVTGFRRVKRAQVDFGPTLNVLYGPNDLGKSTLATAIYAALLAPPKSGDYDSWYGDGATGPYVALTFEEDERFWRVEKTFGAKGTAQLESSKDGHTFVPEARGREVEEKLRGLLQWGVKPPGGAGGPRGLPASFLTNALLAPQDAVEAILAGGLERDSDDSGKLRLTAALSALAQNPLFAAVLKQAQKEADRWLTPSGRRRLDAGSDFRRVNEEIKTLQRDLDEVTEAVTRSGGVEAEANTLRAQRAQATIELDEAEAKAKEAREAHERARARLEAERLLALAEREVADAEKVRAALQACSTKRASLRAEVEALEALVAKADGAVRMAEEAVEQAKARLHAVEKESGAEALALRQAQLSAELATSQALVEKLSAQSRRALEAEGARKAADALKLDGAKLEDALGELEEAASRADDALKASEAEEALASKVAAYARWREAQARQAAASTDRDAASRLREDALACQAEATQLEAAAQREEASPARQRRLPSSPELRPLEALEQQLIVARAELRGAFRVTVRPHRPVAIRATVDEQPMVDEPAAGEARESAGAATLAAERSYEAERRVLLSIGEELDVEVTSGTAVARAALEVLESRWAADASPVLEAAGVPSLAELRRLMEEDARSAATRREQRARAAALRQAAQQRLAQAELHERRVGEAPSLEQLARLEAAVPEGERAGLQDFFSRLGADWEKSTSELIGTTRVKVSRAREALSAATGALETARRRRDGARERQLEAEARASTLAEETSGLRPSALQAELARAQVTRGDLVRSVSALGASASIAVDEAKRGVVAASRGLELARTARGAAEEQVKARRAVADATAGEEAALTTQLQTLDVDGRGSRREVARAAFEAVRHLPVITDEDVAAAERLVQQRRSALEEVSRAFHTADGRLSSVGGPAAKDRRHELSRALTAAQARERQLGLDADAWKLLRDTLVDVEKEQDAHLGQALSAAVTTRFAALTQARYGAITMTTSMATQAVALPGTSAAPDAVLGGLSVGTKDQLATLIRLAIAQELKTAIVLDDQLVHTDLSRLGWFADTLRAVAREAQVLVFTCRPRDYLSGALSDGGPAVKDGEGVQAIDLGRGIETWG